MSIQRFFVFLVSSLFFFSNFTFGQNSPFLKLNEAGVEPSPIKEALNSNEEILTDINGNLIGASKGEIIDSEKKLRLNFKNGESLLIIPYQFTAISNNLSNIITYGEYFEFDVFNKLFIIVYSNDGTLVSSFDSKLFWPYAIGLYDDGNFIAAGSDEKENNTIIRKYADNGTPIWERKIRQAADLKIKISPANRFFSIILRDSRLQKRILYIFDNSGIKLYEEEHPEDMHNFEFISDNKLVIFGASKWILYSLNNTVVRTGHGKIRGKPAGMYPVTGIDGGDSFAVLLFSETGDGYNLQIIDSKSGAISSSQKINKKPTWGNYRRVNINPANMLEVYTENEKIIYTME